MTLFTENPLERMMIQKPGDGLSDEEQEDEEA